MSTPPVSDKDRATGERGVDGRQSGEQDTARDPWGRVTVADYGPPRLPKWAPAQLHADLRRGLPSTIGEVPLHSYPGPVPFGAVKVYVNRSGGWTIVELYQELPTAASTCLELAAGDAEVAKLLHQTFVQWNRDMDQLTNLRRPRLPPGMAMGELRAINEEVFKLVLQAASEMMKAGGVLEILRTLARTVSRVVLTRRAGGPGGTPKPASKTQGQPPSPSVVTSLQTLRDLAKAIMERLKREGKRIVVSIGGKGEVRDAINVNPLYDTPEVANSIPNLLKAPGELLDELLPAGSVDEIVSSNLQFVGGVIDWKKIATASFKVLKPGGGVQLHAFSGEAGPLLDALKSAGFVDVVEGLVGFERKGAGLASAVKPR
jgi:hypothetical protein